ncbi:MAG TPA: thioredoxin domain-containing protein [Gemmatimonadaceae bacterium]
MPKHLVNFGAALIAALLTTACNSANTPPRAEGATPPAAEQTKNSGTSDPLLAAADKGRIAGDSTAKTWVIIASDFQCPFCRQWHDESYKSFVDEYVRSGKVKVAYINYPLGQHQNAVPTAQAAMCASAQNKFWQYHDALFASQDSWKDMSNPRPVLDSIAKAVGVNFDEWSKCLSSERMLPLVFADRDRASSAGVKSTPTFLVGGHVIAGAMPLNEMRPVLDSAIAKSRSGPAR